jgi:hypothetical protein
MHILRFFWFSGHIFSILYFWMYILNKLSFYQYFFVNIFIYLFIYLYKQNNVEFKMILNFDHNINMVFDFPQTYYGFTKNTSRELSFRLIVGLLILFIDRRDNIVQRTKY